MPPHDEKLFDYFISRMPEQARILDLGCGSGIPIAKRMAEQDFSVLGVDRSGKLLGKAKENVPSANFYHSDIENYDITSTYDGVILWDSLFHIPREQHEDILQKIRRALTSDGLLIMSSGGSEQELPAFTDFMFGVEFFYDSFTPDKLLSLCQKIGFTVSEYAVVNEPDGERDKGRVGIILAKA